jgi:hypothetical protein
MGDFCETYFAAKYQVSVSASEYTSEDAALTALFEQLHAVDETLEYGGLEVTTVTTADGDVYEVQFVLLGNNTVAAAELEAHFEEAAFENWSVTVVTGIDTNSTSDPPVDTNNSKDDVWLIVTLVTTGTLACVAIYMVVKNQFGKYKKKIVKTYTVPE